MRARDRADEPPLGPPIEPGQLGTGTITELLSKPTRKRKRPLGFAPPKPRAKSKR